jgi:hypothetical protein
MRKDVDLGIGKDMRLVEMEINRQMRKNLAPKPNTLQDTRKIAQSLVQLINEIE